MIKIDSLTRIFLSFFLSFIHSFTCKETRQWEVEKELVSSPIARFGHTATKVGHWLFVFGGCGGEDYLNDLLLLNLRTHSLDKT